MGLMQYPTVKVIDPANAYIAAEARILAWGEMRRIAARSGCRLYEERVGLITKRFTARGDATQLERFVRLAWDSELLGPSFRKELASLCGAEPCECHTRLGNDFYFLPSGSCLRSDGKCNGDRDG